MRDRSVRLAWALILTLAGFCGWVTPAVAVQEKSKPADESTPPEVTESSNALSADEVAGRMFAPDHIVDVQIQVAEDDWDRIRLQSRSLMGSLANDGVQESPFDYVPADVTIDGISIERVGLRKKGFLGSLDNDRPSLKIKFDEYRNQEPFGDVDRLTLNNNKQDPSLLSQYMSYRFFNQSGTFASRCNFARVTVNGKSLGIYSNVESVKPPMLARGFGDGSGALFEGTVADLAPGVVDRLEMKSKRSDRDQVRRVSELLAADSLDLTELEKEVDLDAFFRFWATESLLGFWDGYTHNQNNFFVYHRPDNSKLYFMPWGLDSALTNTVPPVIDSIENASFHSNAALANRLYRDRRTRKRYRRSLDQLLADHWDEDALLAEIDRVEAMLKNEVRDQRRFLGSVRRVKAFVRQRRDVLQSELQKWPIPIRFGPRRPGYAKQIGELTATFRTEWMGATSSKTSPENERSPSGKNQVEMKMTYQGKPVSFRSVDVTTKMDKSSLFGSDGSQVPTLTLTGVRDADGTPLTMSISIGPADFQPSSEPVAVGGLFREGSLITFFTMMAFNPAAIKMIDGTVRLTEASRKPGDPVAGTADLRILTFAGGQKPKVDWQE